MNLNNLTIGDTPHRREGVDLNKTIHIDTPREKPIEEKDTGTFLGKVLEEKENKKECHDPKCPIKAFKICNDEFKIKLKQHQIDQNLFKVYAIDIYNLSTACKKYASITKGPKKSICKGSCGLLMRDWDDLEKHYKDSIIIDYPPIDFPIESKEEKINIILLDINELLNIFRRNNTSNKMVINLLDTIDTKIELIKKYNCGINE